MKVKLLKKIRSRIVSIEFCTKCYTIEYYNKNDELSCYSVFCREQMIYLIRCMFGERFAKVIERKNNKANLKRIKKRLASSIKYTWINGVE